MDLYTLSLIPRLLYHKPQPVKAAPLRRPREIRLGTYPAPVRMRAAAGQYETKVKEVVKMNNTIFWQGGAF